VSCAAVVGLDDHFPYPDGGGDDEGGGDALFLPDGAPTPETGPGPGDDASPDHSDSAPPTNFSALGDKTKWEFFDLAPLPKTSGFAGGVFDGRYVYFASNARSILRFDSTAPFASETSWVIASTTTASIPASNSGFVKLAQYIYEAPLYAGYLVGRYDTTEPFVDGGTAAFGSHEPPSAGNVLFQGGCTDGKLVYFVPFQYYDGVNNGYVGSLLTYDPNGAGFFSDSSWTVTNLTTFNPSAYGYSECVFDGQYIYFGNNRTGYAARYDTTKPLSMASSWVFFQVNQINPNLYGFNGLVYTGRYVVSVPHYLGPSYASLAVAFDTTAKFGETASWTPYNLQMTDGGASAVGYAGGQFDGRYVYIAPNQSGLVFRWDSTRAFDDPLAWENFDINAVHSGASHFFGTAFDGQYVYFSTNGGSAMARFHARDTSAQVTSPGSFF
jgi:hypothetical protein